jgi:hypothetical protein
LQVLYDLATTGTLEKEIFPTNIVAYNLIPLELPPLDVDQNLLGNLKYVGFCCFGLVALCAAGCVGWTVYRRSSLVVRAAQPFFLVMVAGGVLIMSGSLIPLSFDDGGDLSPISETFAVGICMSRPWLAFTGFTGECWKTKTRRCYSFRKHSNMIERVCFAHVLPLGWFADVCISLLQLVFT